MEPTKPIPQSCFVPGTKVAYAWDSTMLGYYKDCPRKYYYYMVLGIRPKGTGHHLLFGQYYQAALETYAKEKVRNGSHELALREAVLRGLRLSVSYVPPEIDTKKTRANLIRTIIWKLDHFQNSPLKTITLHDGTPAVELSFRFGIGAEVMDGYEILLCGHFDELVDFNGDAFVLDNKTTGGSIGPYYFKQYSPNNQMSLYTIGGKMVYQIPCKGVIIDAAQIMVGFSEFARGFAYRTEGQNEEWLDGAVEWIHRARDNALLMLEDPTKPDKAWPMNDKHCGDYGGCPFMGLCDKDPSMRHAFIATSYEKHEWNPLIPRE